MTHGEPLRPYLDRQIVSRGGFLAAFPVLIAGILGCAQPNRSPEKPAPVGVPRPATVGPPPAEPTIVSARTATIHPTTHVRTTTRATNN